MSKYSCRKSSVMKYFKDSSKEYLWYYNMTDMFCWHRPATCLYRSLRTSWNQWSLVHWAIEHILLSWKDMFAFLNTQSYAANYIACLHRFQHKFWRKLRFFWCNKRATFFVFRNFNISLWYNNFCICFIG